MLHTLAHEAMATTFQLVIAHDDSVYARQAAAEAFAELDQIDARLSRFAEGSDIWRINRLRAGEAAFVHDDALECLRIAERVRRDTFGAFDVACESQVSPEGATGKMPVPPTAESGGGTGFQPVRRNTPLLALDEARHTAQVLAEGTRLDLGGIGKGYALDRMAALLREWEIVSALLCASTSTLLALAHPPENEGRACIPGRGRGWAADFGPENAPQRLVLANQALSASGLAAKGSHIVDPRTGRRAERRFRAWALAPTAALADALSTAFMVMGDREIRACCRRLGVSAHLLDSPTGACTAMPL